MPTIYTTNKHQVILTNLTMFRSSINSFSLLNSSYIAYRYTTNVNETTKLAAVKCTALGHIQSLKQVSKIRSHRSLVTLMTANGFIQS